MFPNYRSLDTLKKARGGFSFPSNRLNDIGQFLGVCEKLPHSGFSMWKDVMNGDVEQLETMIDYCERDVILLEDVYKSMQQYVVNNTHAGVIQGGFKHECPNCGNEHATLVKNNVTSKGTIKRLMECDACEYTYEISNSAYALMLKFKNKIGNPIGFNISVLNKFKKIKGDVGAKFMVKRLKKNSVFLNVKTDKIFKDFDRLSDF